MRKEMEAAEMLFWWHRSPRPKEVARITLCKVGNVFLKFSLNDKLW